MMCETIFHHFPKILHQIQFRSPFSHSKIHDQSCQEMHRLFAKKTEDMNEDNNIVITEHLHLVCDGLPVGEDIAEVAGPQHVPQRGGGQQPGRAAVVVHVGHGADRILERYIFLKQLLNIFFQM